MRTTFLTRGAAVAVSFAVVVALAGCTADSVVRSVARAADGLYASGGAAGYPGEYAGDDAGEYAGDAGSSESGFGPVEVAGPVDWSALASCDDDSGGAPWVLVGTFPADAIDEAGIFPFCGDTFIVDDGDSFVGAVATTTQYEIFLLGGKLTSAGYVLTSDDFDPAPYEGSGQLVGSREYTLGDASLVITAYDNGVRPLSLTVFLDYYAPETRALNGTPA